MHRLIAIALLTFWTLFFASLAHLSLMGMLNHSVQSASELQLLMTAAGQFQIMPVVLMVVSALFIWAVLALLVTDDIIGFREIETYAYGSAIFTMSACSLLAVANFNIIMSLPAIVVAALAACAVASQHLSIAIEPEIEMDQGRTFARQMALGAAHNSLLVRVSRRPLPGQKPSTQNVSLFPIKPSNGSQL